MIKPERLKVDPDRPYAFKSRWKTFWVRWMDHIGNIFFRPSNSFVPWSGMKKIAVLRLDHLGDALLALPAVQALEQALPNVQVDFFIGPWAKDIVEIAGLRAALKVFAASWFSRDGGPGGTVDELAGLLREGDYDAVIELRGDFRHILAMYRAGIKYRIGLARTGLGFLLTHPLVYEAGLHEMIRNLNCLEQAGVPFANPQKYPRIYPGGDDELNLKKIRQTMGVKKPVIVIHAICSALSKRWPVSSWCRLIDGLPEKADVVMVGTESEKAGMEEVQRGCERKVVMAAGRLSLPVLATFLKESELFIGVDSGPAHIAAAVGTPVVSLYSGTNVVDQWGPRGPQVSVIQKKTPCSPCELTICPLGNECMRRIEVDEVLKKCFLVFDKKMGSV